MSKEVWRLFWYDRPVCLLRDVECGDWPFLDAAFDPREFPKDLADALRRELWSRDHDDPEEEDGDSDPGPSIDYLTGWSVLEPNGTRQDVSISHVDFVNGLLTWR